MKRDEDLEHSKGWGGGGMKGTIERRQQSMVMLTAENQQGVFEGKVKVGEDDLTSLQKLWG